MMTATDIWRMGRIIFCVIGFGGLVAGVLVFIDWWFNKRNRNGQ